MTATPDCGPEALTALAAAHGVATSVDAIRSSLAPDRRGASLLELVEAARAIGLDALAVETGVDHLDDLPLPFVAHVDGHHWVLVRSLAEDAVVLEDPHDGPQATRRSVFAQRWSGFALVVQSD